ncbi:MAG: RNA polymerase factor sigma-54 [Acidiferrobacterales bacterium]|nr:RNA polymerase factor sigma-54 [Acidiferrobacterales bacterium]
MKQTLNLQLSQRLTLTPQLRQSLKLLQLSSVDLENEIQHCLDTNPLLERDEGETDISKSDTSNSTDNNSEDSSLEKNSEDKDSGSTLSNSDLESIDFNQTTYQNDAQDAAQGTDDHLSSEQDSPNSWDETYLERPTTHSNSSSESSTEITQFVSKQETLFEHLNWQILMTPLSEKDKSIARSLLHSLDDEGYLTAELCEIKDMFTASLDVDIDEIQAVLNLIKTLEPKGVGARNLRERLLIFLEQMPAQTYGLDIAKLIVRDHLELVAAHNIAKLKKVLGLNDESLSASINLITQLNPRIATEFKSDQLDYIIPDIIVKKTKQNWQAFINPDNQSKLRINQLYANMLKSSIDEAGTEYIQSNLQQAKMFIKGLMSRYDTLLLVSQAVVERQQAFFENGEHAMQPMVLQDIANELDMHESTVSRATSGKYLTSNRGVFELKYFFSSALSSTDGRPSSSTAIRSLIKKMIEEESKDKPLSDSKIAKLLEQQGHIVARRTVAKYRESMQIAPSSQRKSLLR